MGSDTQKNSGSFTQSQTQQGQQVQTPWEQYSPYLVNAWNLGQQAYNTYDRSPYENQISAGPTSEQQKAARLTKQVANTMLRGDSGLQEYLRTGTMPSGGGGGGFALNQIGKDEMRQLGMDMVTGKYLSPESNPYIADAVAAAQRSVSDQFTRGVLPQMGSAAQQAGAYGGSRQGVMEGLAASELQQNLGDIASNMYYGNYANERELQMRSPELFNAALSIEERAAANARANAAASRAASQAALDNMLRPLNMLMGVGEMKQGWNQSALDAALKQNLMNRELTSGFTGLDTLGSLLGLGSPFGTTTTSGTSSTSGRTQEQAQTEQSLFSTLMGGLATGAGIGKLAGWWGAPA